MFTPACLSVRLAHISQSALVDEYFFVNGKRTAILNVVPLAFRQKLLNLRSF